jgi:AI-2E family transporter
LPGTAPAARRRGFGGAVLNGRHILAPDIAEWGLASAPTVPTPARLDGNHLYRASRSEYQRPETSNMTTSGLGADARWPLPRGLIVVLSMTGLLVSVLALKQFAGIIAPVLLALILVISFHPLIGILRRRGAPQWLAVTITLLALIAVILGMAISLGLSVGRLATILPNYQAAKLMVIVLVGYPLINFAIQSVIQPKVMADAVNLSLTLTFVSLIFWTFVIGAMGAVLAVPLTLLTKALLLDVDPDTRWISSLVTGGPTPPEDVSAEAPSTTQAALEVASEEVTSQGAALASDGQDPSPSRTE